MIKPFKILLILFLCAAYAYSANAANNVPSLKSKAINEDAKTESDIKRVCDENTGRLTIIYNPGKYIENYKGSQKTVVFDSKDAVSEAYRRFPTRKPFDDFYSDITIDVAYLKASENGEKMSLGAAYEICREKGMRLPDILELEAAYDAQKSMPADGCSFKPDEYAIGGFWLAGAFPKTPSMVFNMAAGKRVDYDDVKELKRVRCVEN